jgi:hypothetical protein
MTRPLRLRRLGLTALLLALFTVACSDKSSGPSPTAPSPTSSGSAPAPSSAGATINGTVLPPSDSTSSSTSIGPRDAAGVARVEVVGTALAAPVDGGGRFALVGVPAGAVRLKFTGPSANATVDITDLHNGDVITIVVTVSSGSANVVGDSRNPNAAQVPINGLVAGLTGAAAAFQFTIDGHLISGDARTDFFGDGNRANSFADLQNGARVEVKAQPQGVNFYAMRIHINKNGNGNH